MRTGKRRGLANVLYATRASIALNALLTPRLTVLVYHRVFSVPGRDFDAYGPNVSASPYAFAEQLDFLRAHCDVVSLADVEAAVHGSRLPRRAVLVTFDDGYRDNVELALPLLVERSLPAAVFLATDYVGGAKAFFWDAVARAFQRTERCSADLPLIGVRRWASPGTRTAAAEEVIQAMKHLAAVTELDWAVGSLQEALDVRVDLHSFESLYLNWNEIRQAATKGLAFGSHTCSHAILSRLPLEAIRAELVNSKQVIESELGQQITAVAYPNGEADERTERAARDAGYQIGFSGLPGPCSTRALRAAPMAIRRVPIYSRDTLPAFVGKLVGLARVRPYPLRTSEPALPAGARTTQPVA